VSEDFGRSLDIFLSSNAKVHCRMYCEIVQKSSGYKTNYKLAMIYRIEVFNLAGGVHTIYEEGKEPVIVARPARF
jgi:hypothetical protein